MMICEAASCSVIAELCRHLRHACQHAYSCWPMAGPRLMHLTLCSTQAAEALRHTTVSIALVAPHPGYKLARMTSGQYSPGLRHIKLFN